LHLRPLGGRVSRTQASIAVTLAFMISASIALARFTSRSPGRSCWYARKGLAGAFLGRRRFVRCPPFSGFLPFYGFLRAGVRRGVATGLFDGYWEFCFSRLSRSPSGARSRPRPPSPFLGQARLFLRATSVRVREFRSPTKREPSTRSAFVGTCISKSQFNELRAG
jgi:hypothetical protein